MNYYLWNKLICQRFFNLENKGRRVYLSVTEADLEEISNDFPDLRLGGFNGFVNSIIEGPIALQEVYWKSIHKKALQLYRLYMKPNKLGSDKEWISLSRDRLKYPPFVGYLAFFVLAEFENINTTSSIAYYDKVDQLLSKFLSYEKVLDTFYPRSLYPIDHLWDELSSWSINVVEGQYGEFVTHQRESFKYVFRAKEQALLNYSDRKKLYSVLSKNFTPYFLPNIRQVGTVLQNHTFSRYASLFVDDIMMEASQENRLLRKTIYNIIIHDLQNGLINSATDPIQKVLYLVPFLSFQELLGGRITYRINIRKSELKEFTIEFNGKSFQIRPSSQSPDWSQPVSNEVDLHLTGKDWSSNPLLKVLQSESELLWNPRDITIFSKTKVSKIFPGEPYVEVNRMKIGGNYLIATNNSQKFSVIENALADGEICDNYEFETVIDNKPEGWNFVRIEDIRNGFAQLPELYVEFEDDFTLDSLEIKIELIGGIKIKSGQYLNIALPTIQINDFTPKILEVGGNFSIKAFKDRQAYELYPNSEHSIIFAAGPDYFDDYAEFYIHGIPEEGTLFKIEACIPNGSKYDTYSLEFQVIDGILKSPDLPVGRDKFGRTISDGELQGYYLVNWLSTDKIEASLLDINLNGSSINRENLSLDLSPDNLSEVLKDLDLLTDVKESDIKKKIIELRRKIELLKLRLRDENL